MLGKNEMELMQRQQETQQQQAQLQQQQMQMEAQSKEADMQLKDQMNQRDNETKILIATIQANAKQVPETSQSQDQGMTEAERAKLNEQIREFDANLDFLKQKQAEDARLKEKQINKPKTTTK